MKYKKHKFPFKWKLKDLKKQEKNGYKVFSCFAGGGGSSLGYKLAGFDVIGFNEIDLKMAECYITNLNPKYNFILDIKKFNKIKKPDELYNLDILDGSPPCSVFSRSAYQREKRWGKEIKFREGQKKQVLDTLFFDFIETVSILKPKIVVAENVKGLQIGDAKKYIIKIIKKFNEIGYSIHYRLLDASLMGVPQKRERVFFFGIRKEYLKKINTIGLFKEPYLKYNKECIIPFNKIADYKGKLQTEININAWQYRKRGDINIVPAKKRAKIPPHNFNLFFVYDNLPLPTLPAKGNSCSILFDKPIRLSKMEWLLGSTFPLDYNFCKLKPEYVSGMSVPPVMMANIATQIKIQWLNEIYKEN